MKISNPFGKFDPRFKEAEQLVRKIEKKYREHLLHSGTWIGKTAALEVVIIPIFSNVTNGYAGREFKDGRVIYKITLIINPKDSTCAIAYVIAHEFAHMLFNSFHDHLTLLDRFAPTQDSGSSIARTDNGTQENWGIGLEEGAADLAALYILSHCRIPDENGAFADLKERLNRPDSILPLVRRFAEMFGSPLESLPHLDDFTHEEVKVYQSDPQYSELGPQYNPTLLYYVGEPYRVYYNTCITNMFWYAAATASFRTIIGLYEEAMGDGSYRELCRDLDYIQKHYREHDPEPEYVLEQRRATLEKLKTAENDPTIENLMEDLPEWEIEPAVPASPEEILSACRRVTETLDRFEHLWNEEEDGGDAGTGGDRTGGTF